MNFKYLKDDSKILRSVSQPNSLWKALRFSFPIAILGWQLGQRKVGGECIALWHNCRSQRLSVSRQDLSDPGKKSEQVSKSTEYQQQLWPINITFVAPASRWDLSSVTTGTNARGSSLSQFSRLIKLGLLGLLSSLKEKKKKCKAWVGFHLCKYHLFWEQQGCETSLRSLLSAVGVAAHSQSIVIRSQKGRETRPTQAKDAAAKKSAEIWRLLLASWSAFILAVLKLSWLYANVLHS